MRCTSLCFYSMPLLAAFLSGCATGPKVEESVISAPIDAMEKPSVSEGQIYHRIDVGNGDEGYWTVTAVHSDGSIDGRNHEGCSWTMQAEWFSPVLAWDNCGSGAWKTGTRTINSSTGSLWPLKVGNKATYKHSYKNASGRSGSRPRSCEVEAAVRITVPMGEYDTYKVVCKDSYGTDYDTTTWYMSPEHGEIKYMRVHSKDGIKRNFEVVKIENL